MSYESHLTEHDIERLLQERMSLETTRAAHQHLWVCDVCRQKLLQHADAALYLEEIYGAGTVTYWRTCLVKWGDAWLTTVERSVDVSRLAVQHLYMKTRNNATFQDPSTLAIVLERGYELRKADPAAAKKLLTGAIDTLKTLAHWPIAERNCLLGRAFAYRANTCRIMSERAEAAADLDRAEKRLSGLGKPTLAGLIATFKGNLAKDCGDYPSAIASLLAAIRLLPISNEAVTKLDASIVLANTYGLARQWQQNVNTLRKLLENNPKSGFASGAYLACVQSLAWGYAHLGLPDKAEELLAEIWRVARKEGNRLDLVRVRWLEAEIFKARGNRTLAASRFRAVTSQFMAAELPVDAAIAALSQAGMYLDLGDTRAAAALADDLVPIFRSKGIHREATAAGLIVVEDLRRQAATAGQLQELVGRLQGRG